MGEAKNGFPVGYRSEAPATPTPPEQVTWKSWTPKPYGAEARLKEWLSKGEKASAEQKRGCGEREQGEPEAWILGLESLCLEEHG